MMAMDGDGSRGAQRRVIGSCVVKTSVYNEISASDSHHGLGRRD